MSSGALTPLKAVEALYHDGLHHLHEPIQLAFLKNVAGGLLMGLSGLFSMVAAGGCTGLHSSNIGIVRLIQGAAFSVGLVFVYFTGAELYTGYPMWLMMTSLQRKGRPRQYIQAIMNSLLGNLAGALIAAGLFSYATESLSEEPYRSFVIEQVESNIVQTDWHVIMIKAIGCGYLVTFAMLLGTQNMDGISKALGLWLPFVVATTVEFPHTVEYMYLVPMGMMLGAPLSVGGFVWKCLLPIVVGNSIGGAVFTGLYHWWVYLKCKNGQEKIIPTFGEYMDMEDGEEEG